ncbi:MAG: phosphoribosylaminoimidazolesuccinocarboxamide synthase [Chitinispirillaceae bacterium]|jgi:phosphoribosylaminoimidazole-succinocarboxamide synthase|nr:phosphoribosylaminoimidazolesuccinocarboxamide synthase [Chitinispirillaceae bacterium]
MFPRERIQQNLKNCLDETTFLSLPGFRKGKVRDTYDLGDSLVLITTDRQSAFDRVLATVPFKGQVLNQVSGFWFEQTQHIVKNQIISIPDPNVTIAKKCSVFPIEFVVRGYLTGSTDTSAWMQYAGGKRDICGNMLPEGMVKNQKFSAPILTPTTKADAHDESISAAEIVKRGIIDPETWKTLESIVMNLFSFGSELAAKNGLILVDTKYELGLDVSGNILLIDEVHTPDSSRYWIGKTYSERFSRGEEPENIDKEFLRLWFRKNCDPYADKVLPEAPDELVVELSARYIQLYEMITGKAFVSNGDMPVQDRITGNLKSAGIL